MLELRFFASLRDQLNCDGESLNWSDNFNTVSDVRKVLVARGTPWETLSKSTVLIAINQEMGNNETVINDGDEIAFFPPVTGG